MRLAYYALGTAATLLLISGEHVPHPLGTVYCLVGSGIVSFLAYAAGDR